MKLYSAPFVLTMDDNNQAIEDGAVLVDQRIVAVGQADDLKAQYPEVEVEHFADHLLMPGLINTHMHSGFLRGTAEGLKLWDWLRLYIDPMHRVLEPEDAEIASWLCYGEGLLSGTTTLVDMWRFLDGSGRAAEQLGNRVLLVPYVGEHPEYNYFETLDSNERLINNWLDAANGRVMPWVGMEHVFYFTEDAYRRAIDMANHYGVGLHTHVGESQAEVTELDQRYGLRPVHAMEKLGFLDIDTVLFAHCVWLDEAEIRLMAEKHIGVAHNPTSNLKLASGMAPITEMIKAGVHVGIGSDGEKENNNLDLFEEMKFASLVAKHREADATVGEAWQTLRMATIEGARAIGLGDSLGSLEAGKQADMIAVRTDTPRMTPLMTGEFFNLHHNLVYAAQGGDVDWVMCDGAEVVRDKVLQTASMRDIRGEVQARANSLFERRSNWLKNNQTMVDQVQFADE